MYEKKTMVCWLAIIIILFTEEIQMCEDEICFSWRQLGKSLVFTCTVSNALYKISIDDPSSKTRAYCIPLFTCVHLKPKPSYLKRPINQLVFEIPDPESIQPSINGTWSCRHGSRLGIAKLKLQFAYTTGIYLTNVIESTTEYSNLHLPQSTVPHQAIIDLKTTEKIIPTTNVEITSLYSFLSSNGETISTTKRTLAVLTVKPTDSNSKETLFGFYLIPSIVVLVICFTICCLCNIWISKKCSSAATTGDVEQIVQRFLVTNDQNLVFEPTDIQDNTCEEYEYIDDMNMVESVPIVHTMTLPETRIERDIDASENQYLEVISGEETYESVTPKTPNSTENIYCDISYPNSNICNIQIEKLNSRKKLTFSNCKNTIHQQDSDFTCKSCPELCSLKNENTDIVADTNHKTATL